MPWSIGIDWGTTSLRAMLFDDSGEVQETRTRSWGIRQLPEGRFEAAFADICAGWPTCPVIASGMIGSQQGWREVRYVDTPVDMEMLIGGLATIQAANDRSLFIVPGVRDAVTPDVMRGEETQVMGALESFPKLAAEAQFVLPGTHSKWVDVRAGRIVHFSTMMTGEMYALLRDRSILGAAQSNVPEPDTHPEAFDDGVRAARASGNAGGLTRIFSARALMLESRLDPAAVPDYLSGVLIGEEWRAMLASGWLRANRPPTLIGEDGLCARYRRAATLFDLPQPQTIAGAAARGLWCLLKAAAARQTNAHSSLTPSPC